MAARGSQSLIEVIQPVTQARASQQLLEAVLFQPKGVKATQELLEVVLPYPAPPRVRDTQETLEVLWQPPLIKGARFTQEVVEALFYPGVAASQLLIEVVSAGPPPICSQVLIESVTRLIYEEEEIAIDLAVEENERCTLTVYRPALRKRVKNIIEGKE